MTDSIFDSIFAGGNSSITIAKLCLVLGFGIICGIITALFYTFRTKYTHGFLCTLSLLPATVAVVILAVNGNIGAGVAVAGAFSLVRFRSAPGSAKEIVSIFMAMASGLLCGMGYLAYAVSVSVMLGGAGFIFNLFSGKNGITSNKTLRITVPEDLDYTDIFTNVFNEYTKSHSLTQVKTTNMGSLFKLSYDITLKDISKEREMLNRLRCLNGNLEISISVSETNEL